MEKRPLCIDGHTHPKTVKDILRDMKRMVRFGKVAEKALRDLEARGFYRGRAPSLKEARLAGGNWSHAVTQHVFPSPVNASRADFPDYGNFVLRFGQFTTGKHGGHPTREIPLFLNAQIFNRSREWDWREYPLGDVRVKKNGWMNLICRDSPSTSIRIYANDSTESAGISYQDMASYMRNILIQQSEWGKQRNFYPQKIIDLHHMLPQWLIEDGHIKRLCQEMISYVKVAQVFAA